MVHEDEVCLFAKFKEILTTLQVSILFHEILELIPKFVKFMKTLLKEKKKMLMLENVSMTEKKEVAEPQALPPKIKYPG